MAWLRPVPCCSAAAAGEGEAHTQPHAALILLCLHPLPPSPSRQVGLLNGDATRIHCNPDCGLKTRKWEEVLPSLRNLVAAAKLCRAELASHAALATPTKAGTGAAISACAGVVPAAPAAERRVSCTSGCCAQGE